MQTERPATEGYKTAYLFTEWERKTIAKHIKNEIKRLDKRIERIENHPKNEGQATFSAKIDRLEDKKEAIKEIISALL
jgi:septation ring formation regulator EzrA